MFCVSGRQRTPTRCIQMFTPRSTGPFAKNLFRQSLFFAIADRRNNLIKLCTEADIMKFSDKTCIVTGATSGIGLAIATELAKQGANLVLVGRNISKGEAVAQSMQAKGTEVLFVPADLADRTSPARIVASTLARFGRIDVLINNAGMLINGTALECTDEEWDQVMDINVGSAFRMSRAVLPAMLDQEQGSIVNVASDWALMGAEGAVAYCVSKSALTQLTRCMALDHARAGLRVNAICPTDTDTPMLDLAYPGDDRDWKVQTLADTIPMRRVARPEEVAKVAAFLASDDASFMTGSLVPIDGGTSAR